MNPKNKQIQRIKLYLDDIKQIATDMKKADPQILPFQEEAIHFRIKLIKQHLNSL